jgi:hypothetical protein
LGELEVRRELAGYERTENFAYPGGQVCGTILKPRFYQLIRQPNPIGERRFEIEFLDPGVEAFDFTFRLMAKRCNQGEHTGGKDMANLKDEASASKVDLKLEAVVIPVSDVDRSKQFYNGLGWRLDADFAFDNGFRVVQVTPPGSGCSIQFGIATANMNRPRPSITGRTGTPPTSSHARTGARPTRQPRMPSST